MLNLDHPPVSLLYVPGNKPRALDKAAGLDADAIIIDLEDAVPPEEKAMARDAAAHSVRAGMAGKAVLVRINGVGTAWHEEDVAAFADARPDAVQLPKVERVAEVAAVAASLPATPIFPMIETAIGVYAARDIAAHPSSAALVAGLNDLAMDLGVPDPANRAAMMVAIQTILLAARAEAVLAYDGVWTGLDDEAGLIAECAEGRALGFDGKTLIHPNQIAACNAAWLPSQADVETAHAMVAAVALGSTSGAIRFRGKMVEDMHIKAAKRLIARSVLRGARQI
jgi:(3S)-malyl-CoA thioesterase